MKLITPTPFAEAVAKLGSKSPIGSQLNSLQWGAVPVALRERAFFSSTIENVRFLQRAKDSISDFLNSATETTESGETALKTGSRADFIKQLQDFAISEGMGPLDPKDAGTIKDITSERRLGLIFDTQTRQAFDYGNWKQGQDPDILNEFPAQRFIRVQEVKEPRDSHQTQEGAVALKTNLTFWLRLNEDFGVPWGPWAWGCGHDVEDVDRDEAEALGLIKPGQRLAPAEKSFNDHLKASTAGIDPDLANFLDQAFGNQITWHGDTVSWNPSTKSTKSTPTPGTPAPSNPAPSPAPDRPTLEEILKAAQINDDSPTPAAMERLLDQMRESNPVQEKDIVTRITGAKHSGHLTQSSIRSTVQEFLNFIPVETAAKLTKLQIRIRSTSSLGSFGKGGEITINSHISPDRFKATLFHELAHWVHQDGPSDEFRQAVKSHFEDRTKNEPLAPLVGYGSIGKKDKWWEQYAGRVYGWENDPAGLEIPSRYAEFLSWPPHLQAFHWSNPLFRETMKIVLKALT